MPLVKRQPESREKARKYVSEISKRVGDVAVAATKSRNAEPERIELSDADLRKIQSKMTNLHQNYMSGKTHEHDTVNWTAAEQTVERIIENDLKQYGNNYRPQELSRDNNACPVLSGQEYSSNAGDINVNENGVGMLNNIWDALDMMQDIINNAQKLEEEEYEPSVKDVDDTREESNYSFDL